MQLTTRQKHRSAAASTLIPAGRPAIHPSTTTTLIHPLLLLYERKKKSFFSLMRQR
jgi:hypothetical protein